MKILLATGSDKIDKYIQNTATGHQFDTATSRRYIISRNKEHQYHIIVLSGTLSGRENLREIIFETQRESNCRIIYLIGAAKPSDIIDAFLLGVRDFIHDPIDPKLLTTVINEPSTYGMAASNLKKLPIQSEPFLKQVFEIIKKNTPDPPPEVTPEAKEILNGILKLLRQENGKTIEESLLNLEEAISELLTQRI